MRNGTGTTKGRGTIHNIPKKSDYIEQQGEGIPELFGKVASTFGLVGKPDEQLYPGEVHAKRADGKMYNFMGPRSNLTERRKNPAQWTPIDKKDAIAKKHDLAFEAIGQKLKSGKIDKKKFMEEISQSDQEFIDEMSKQPGFTAKAAASAIKIKQQAERIGLLDSSVFSGGGLSEMGKELLTNLQPPDHRLKKKMNPKYKGGLAPFVLPFLIPILSELSIMGLKAVIKLAKGKQTGSGKETDKAVLIKKATDVLDDLSHTKQMDVVQQVLNKI